MQVSRLSRPGTYHDSKVPYLALRINPGGSKTFIIYRRVNGQPRRIRLGRYPAMSLDEARREAQRMLESGPTTVRQGWQEYFTLHAKLKKRSWSQDEYTWDKFVLPHIDSRRDLGYLSQKLIWLHATIGANHGFCMANRVLALCIKVLRFNNVTPPRVERFPEEPRTRFLNGDEMPLFLDTVKTSSIRDFVLLCLYTGARSGNVMQMQWADIIDDVWTVSAARSKNKRVLRIHLCAEAREILAARPRISQFVFPGKYVDSHMARPYRAWRTLCRKARVPDLRIHDLRRTLGSWMAMKGVPLQVIGKTLGHADLASTQIYSQLTMQPVADAVGATVARFTLSPK